MEYVRSSKHGLPAFSQIVFSSALYTDTCLYIVPGSHKEVRTPEQRKRSETQDPPKDPMDMPGAVRLTLQRKSNQYMRTYIPSDLSEAGETVFYNSNILHCATYDSSAPRATLHGCIGDIRGGSTRARNVLQHGLEWMKSDDFKESLPDDLRARHMLDNLLNMQKNNSGPVGYSLQN